MNKRIFIFMGLVILSAMLAACGVASGAPEINTALAASDDGNSVTRSLSVSGTGQVTLTPDIGYMTIGVQTEGPDASEAVAENNTKTQKVIQALEDAGVESKDIKTTNFSIYPQQKYDDRGNPTGEITYIVNNSVFVTMRDLNVVGDLLNVVIESGANTIQGIQFDVEDKNAAFAEAQEKAVANAQAQAENLAEAAGVSLGRVITINTFGGPIPTPKYDGMGGGGLAVSEGASVPISPGEMMVSVEVSMIYEIE